MIRIANAPCSWGVLEFDLEGKSAGYEQVLNEMAQAGYAGTELGDWGFMPTDPKKLKDELHKRNLSMLGAFVPVFFKDEKNHEKGIEVAVKTANLMKNAGFPEAFIVLADDNGTVEERTKNAGRIKPDMGMTPGEWKMFSKGVDKVAAAVKNETGMKTVFHHHCGGYVETPKEVETLLYLTDPSLVGLVLDMGHYMMGGGDPVETLKKHSDRIWHVHFKDYDPHVARIAAEKSYDYFQSVNAGVFCELGKGAVDFPVITSELKKNGFEGWIVVEQDVLPGMGEPLQCALRNRNYIQSLGL